MSYRLEERPGIDVFRNKNETITIKQLTSTPIGEDFVVIHPNDIDAVVAAMLKVRDEILADGAAPGMKPIPNDED